MKFIGLGLVICNSPQRVYFAWRTTSLRVGGRAARRSCLPGLRRGGGGRQASAAVLSSVTVKIDRQTSAFCATGNTPTQTRRRTHPSGGRAALVHIATPDTTKQSCPRRVWRGSVN